MQTSFQILFEMRRAPHQNGLFWLSRIASENLPLCDHLIVLCSPSSRQPIFGRACSSIGWRGHVHCLSTNPNLFERDRHRDAAWSHPCSRRYSCKTGISRRPGPAAGRGLRISYKSLSYPISTAICICSSCNFWFLN